MIRNLRSLGAVLVAVLLLAGSLQLNPVQAQEPVEPAVLTRTVTVTGTGNISVQPDTALVSVGVRTEAEQASEALDENNQQMDALITALEDAGIPEENIQTQFINLSPRYAELPDMSGQPQVTGYVATNTVQVRIEDINQVGETLDTVVEAGGNLIENISFLVSSPGELMDQAREAAFEDARQIAQQYADLAGAELGSVVSINEGGGTAIPFAAGVRDLAVAESVPIQPGQENVQVSVQVTWELLVTDEAGAQ